jgi:hypothetical protein
MEKGQVIILIFFTRSCYFDHCALDRHQSLPMQQQKKKKKRFCRASIWQTPTQHFLTKTGKKFLNTFFVPAFNLKRSAAAAQR